MSRVEIDFTNGGHGPRVVVIDGKELLGVTNVDVSMSVSSIPVVTLEVIATDGYVKIDEAETSIEAHVIQSNRRSK